MANVRLPSLELRCPNEVAKITKAVTVFDRPVDGAWDSRIGCLFQPIRSDPGDDDTVHQEDRTSGKVVKSGDRN